MQSDRSKSYEELLDENEILTAKCQKLEKQLLHAKPVNGQKIYYENLPYIYPLVNSMNIPMFIKDREGKYIFVNPSLEKVLGIEKEKMLGKTVFELFPDTLAGIYHEKDEELYRQGKYQVYEGKIRFHDGEHHSAIFHKTCLWTSENGLFGLIGFIIDNSEMDKAYRLIIMNENKFRMIVENTTELIAKTDIHGCFLYASPSFCKLINKTEEELLGISYLLFVHPEDIPPFMEVLFKIFNPPYTGYHEHRIISQDGWRYIGWSGRAIIDDKGKVTSVIAVGRDVTERIQLQKELENAFEKEQAARREAEAASHEMEIARRKLELTNIELEESLLKAEQANQVKNEFLAIMSHEIRTPLTSMLGFCYLLSMDSHLSEEQRRFIQIIYEAGKRLNAILSDLLELSVIEAGKLELDYRIFNFGELVEDVYILCSENIERKNLEFRMTFGNDIKIVSDQMKIRQVLLNLIGNAAKFTETGFIEVALTERENDFLISITDTGIGIEEKHTELIFDLFRQVETGNNRKYGGTGLGLAICKKLVESLGGQIGVKSTAGKGSTFHFTIPKVEAEIISEADEIIEHQENVDMTKKIKFLYADDDMDIVELIEVLTEEIRHQDSKVFYSGKELIDEFQCNQDYDMIILDVNMPDLNGVECLNIIRKNNIKIPVIALTAFATRADSAKYLDIGFTDYIPKPIDFAEFKKILYRNIH